MPYIRYISVMILTLSFIFISCRNDTIFNLWLISVILPERTDKFISSDNISVVIYQLETEDAVVAQILGDKPGHLFSDVVLGVGG